MRKTDHTVSSEGNRTIGTAEVEIMGKQFDSVELCTWYGGNSTVKRNQYNLLQISLCNRVCHKQKSKQNLQLPGNNSALRFSDLFLHAVLI